MDDTQRKTRSQHQAEVADALGFNIISTVQLDRVGNKNNKTASLVKPKSRNVSSKKVAEKAQLTKRVEKKVAEKAQLTKRVDKKVAKKAKVIKHTKKVESRAETLRRKAEEAKRELLLLTADYESRIQELERNATTKAEVPREKYHPSCVDAFEAFEEDGRDTLSWKHSAALGGQRIAKRNLTEKQLKRVNLNLIHRPSKSNGNYAGHSKEDQSLVAKVKYENGDIGTAKRNEEMALNLNPRIQEMCAKFHRFSSLHSNREGFDILSQYSTGVSLDKVKNLLAVFCYTKDFRTLTQYLSTKGTAGIGGMEIFRILEDGTIVKLRGGNTANYSNAGYRFVFKKGNKTKFDH